MLFENHECIQKWNLTSYHYKSWCLGQTSSTVLQISLKAFEKLTKIGFRRAGLGHVKMLNFVCELHKSLWPLSKIFQGNPWEPSWLVPGWLVTGWLVTGWLVTGWLATGWTEISCPVTGWLVTGWLVTGWLVTGWLVTGDWWLVGLVPGQTLSPPGCHLDGSCPEQ